ncbi:unnamed protein product [Phyllotreta striolata]|uniref:Major facilitator superfamily (MFS) profile domain-containing protein n=1 Tax=Phyllotreta striolata TaxID=444603 RepID=A0A9N9U0K1_PHYSR|nr:unnamed protein product [Phyllotreta striolata]
MEQGGDGESLFKPNEVQFRPYSRSRPLPYSDISIERPGWSLLLIAAGVLTTLGLSLPAGYNIGVVNTPAQLIKEFCKEAVIQRYGGPVGANQLELIFSTIVAIFLIGAAIGSLCGSLLADKIGRKGVLYVCSALGALASICFVSARPAVSLELLYLGRLLIGLCSGLTTSVVPMYLTELAPLHLRGSTGVLCPLGITIGVLAGQIVSMEDILGNEPYWPYCIAAYVVPLVLCALLFPTLPESPKYLFVIRNQHHKAFQQLKRLRNTNERSLGVEIDDLKKEQLENMKNAGANWNMRRVMSDRSLLLPLILVCCLQAGQQLSGINAVFFYSNRIFESAGLSQKENELATIGTGLCNNFMAILSIWTMSYFNRRFCIIASMLSSIFFLVFLGASIMYIDSYSFVPYLSIVGTLGYVLCYGFGLGPIPYFVGSELFEVGPRPSAMALGSMSNWGGNFVVSLTFPMMQYYIGPYSFFLFASITLLLCGFISYYLPETRGKDVKEIVALCKDGFRSKPLQTPVPARVPDYLKMYTNGIV